MNTDLGSGTAARVKTRKTRDEWNVQGNYGQGWEDVSAYDTLREGREGLREYRENETGYPHRLIKRRVRITEAA